VSPTSTSCRQIQSMHLRETRNLRVAYEEAQDRAWWSSHSHNHMLNRLYATRAGSTHAPSADGRCVWFGNRAKREPRPGGSIVYPSIVAREYCQHDGHDGACCPELFRSRDLPNVVVVIVAFPESHGMEQSTYKTRRVVFGPL
jgi:hypothetical protein